MFGPCHRGTDLQSKKFGIEAIDITRGEAAGGKHSPQKLNLCAITQSSTLVEEGDQQRRISFVPCHVISGGSLSKTAGSGPDTFDTKMWLEAKLCKARSITAEI